MESNKEEDEEKKKEAWTIHVSYWQNNERTELIWVTAERDLDSSQFKGNYFTAMCSSVEEGSYLRPNDFCITHLLA